MSNISSDRVRIYRDRIRADGLKTIEIRVTKDICSILDAIALNHGVSRSLFVSDVLNRLVLESGYFLSNGKLYHHDKTF